MYYLLHIINFLMPFFAAIFLILGLKKNNGLLVSVALWLSLFTLVSHYQLSGGEILGDYFNYLRASVYSLNLLILASTAIVILIKYKSDKQILNSATKSLAVIVFLGFLILNVNLWTNAYFISQKMEDTAVIQVATMKPNPICQYRYTFFIINKSGELEYLCPNRYFLLPQMGKVQEMPEFIVQQIPASLLNKAKQSHES